MSFLKLNFLTRSAFLPYLEHSFEEMYKLVNYPQEDIRKAAIEALAQFCINFSKIDTPEGRQGNCQRSRLFDIIFLIPLKLCNLEFFPALSKSLIMVIPKCSELVRMDDELTVAISALDSFSEMIKEIKERVFEGEGHKAAIINCIKDVLTYKV